MMLTALGLEAFAAGQTLTEFPLAVAAGPVGITAGPDGNVWFTEYRHERNAIGRITPDGVITEFRIPTEVAHPLGITTGPDGNLWFTESSFTDGKSQIAFITTSGEISEFLLLGDAYPHSIVAGPDGAMWFTEEGRNAIGRITTSGVITEFPLGFHAGPAGITAGPDGALWFAERYANQIGRITTSGEITHFLIPTPGSHSDCEFDLYACGPISIAVGPDGALWFTEYFQNQIGRITTSGEITEFPIPTPGSGPYGIAAGLDRNLYFTERTGKIGRITTSGEIMEFLAPTPDSKPTGIALGPDGAMWITIQGPDQNPRIGRLSVDPLTYEPADRLVPVPPSPRATTRVLEPRD